MKVGEIQIRDRDQRVQRVHYASPATPAANPVLPLPAGGYRTAAGAAWDGAVTIAN